MGRPCSQNGRRQEGFQNVNILEREFYKGLAGDERTILECILNKLISIQGIGLLRLRTGIIGESL